MKGELLEDFESLRSKGEKLNLEQVSALYFKFVIYIEANVAMSDELKYVRNRLEKDAKEMAVFRDLLKEMKEKLSAKNTG